MWLIIKKMGNFFNSGIVEENKSDIVSEKFTEFVSNSDKYTEEVKQVKINSECNILFLGRTWVGKSSTINALFNISKANINFVEVYTNTITKQKLGKLNIYDSPGLGESKKKRCGKHKRNY